MADDEFDRGWADQGRRFGDRLARDLYRVQVWHAERVPAQGPLVLVSNHTGFLDGPAVFCVTPRTVHFLDDLPRNELGKVQKRRLAT